MRKPSIFTDNEIRFLRELVKSRVPFMIVGLSAAALQGAPVVTQDVDLWFKDLAHPGIGKALRKVDAVYVAPTAFTPPLFAGNGVDLFDIVLNMDGLREFDEELKNAVDVPLDRIRVKVLSLERILVSKQAANREKDQLTIPVLRDALAAIQRERKA